MNRLEPNALLALSTALALTLLVITTAVFGAPDQLIRNGVLALVSASGFVLLSPLLLKVMKLPPRPPLIDPGAPATAPWAAIYPLLLLAAAVIPLLWPGHNYGLLVVIAGVWCGATVDSALKARRA